MRITRKWGIIAALWGGLIMTIPAGGLLGTEQARATGGISTGYTDQLVSEIGYVPASTQTYLASPSLVRLADGTLLVSHDYFGPASPKKTTSVYRSTDDGASWMNIATLSNMLWGTLFEHNGAVYLLGTTGPMESIVIRKSTDGGVTWTTAADASSGLLFPGGTGHPSAYHTAPTPVLKANGRLYKAYESNTPYVWPENFKALMISAPEDADLLQADNWTISNEIAYNPAWTPAAWGSTDPGWLEGNAVQAPNGDIWNVLRFNSYPTPDKAAIIGLAGDHATAAFHPGSGFIEFPGGMSKFTIRRDERTGLYLTLVNNNTYPGKARQRNVLALYASEDLRSWKPVQTLLTDDSGLSMPDSIAKVGFQYVDWQFDGDDLIYVSRTAYDGADDYHNSNRISFHRLSGYRALLDAPAARWKLDEGSGSAAEDSSPYGGVSGEVYGASWTSGMTGGGLSFDGIDDWAGFDPSGELSGRLYGAPALALAGWFQADSWPAGSAEQWLLGLELAAGETGAAIYSRDGHLRVAGRSEPGEAYRYRDFAFTSAGKWHYAAAVLDFAADRIRLYVDGEELEPVQPGAVGFESPVYAPASAGAAGAIGRSPAGGGYFHGKLDDVRIEARSWTEREARALAFEGLEGYWAFDETGGVYAIDGSRYGRNGKLLGAVREPGGAGLRLDGTVDHLDLGYDMAIALRGASGITVAGWVEARAIDNSTAHWLFGTRINGATAGAEVLVYGDAIRIAGRSDLSDGYRYKEFAYPDSAERHHLVAILDYAGNGIRMYVDGVEQMARAGSAGFSSPVYRSGIPTQRDAIGKSPASTETGYLAGIIDEMMVFSKPLTPVQVEHLYRTMADE